MRLGDLNPITPEDAGAALAAAVQLVCQHDWAHTGTTIYTYCWKCGAESTTDRVRSRRRRFIVIRGSGTESPEGRWYDLEEGSVVVENWEAPPGTLCLTFGPTGELQMRDCDGERAEIYRPMEHQERCDHLHP